MTDGKLIVIEGIDGSGKTYQAIELRSNLENATGRLTALLTQPTPEPTGNSIRQILAGNPGEEVHYKVLPLLFAADRFQQQISVVSYLEQNKNVVMDRSYPSSYAYQNDVVDWSFLDTIHEGLLIPDYIFYLQTDVKIAIERINKRNGRRDIFESIDKLTEVKDAYTRLFSEGGYHERHYPSCKIFFINGNNTLYTVTKEISAICESEGLM